MPKGTETAKLCIGAFRREGLPAPDNLAQGVAVHHLNDDMDVVRHEAPRENAIAFAIEMKQCVFDERCDLGPSQPTHARTGIQFMVKMLQGIVPQAQAFEDRTRQAVGESKGDELGGFGRIEVRQVTS